MDCPVKLLKTLVVKSHERISQFDNLSLDTLFVEIDATQPSTDILKVCVFQFSRKNTTSYCLCKCFSDASCVNTTQDGHSLSV